MSWRPYDPKWLADLACQAPEDPWLREALLRCTLAEGPDEGLYIHFVDPSRPNEPGSDWQFRRNIILEHPVHGELVLDILEGDRVGGVEFLSRVLARL